MSEENPNNNEFIKQVSGGTVANLIFAVLFVVYRMFTQKCKHTKCRSHTKCCDFESREDSEDSNKIDNNEQLHREIEELQKSFFRISKGIRTCRNSVIPLIERGGPTDNNELVKQQDLETEV